MTSGATFSTDRRYRYALWRIWEPGTNAVFILLNPSTADETVNDPTISRCIVRAKKMGFGGVIILNIFAWRSTDPDALYGIEDPVGPENNLIIHRELCRSTTGLIVCGWGQHGKHLNRGEHVLNLIQRLGKVPNCLKMNGDGTPAHPLYLSYALQPQPIGAK